MIETATQLKEQILSVISNGGGKAGLKLRTEQDIAERLKIPKHRVRQALGYLKSDGLLIRKRGGGTYLRKPPIFDINLEKSIIEPSQIFEVSNGMNQGEWAKKKLKFSLALWGNIGVVSTAKQLELSGIVKQSQENGHRLSVHSFEQGEHVPIPFNVLKAQMHEYLYDGYIVSSFWADTFKKAFEGVDAPVVYLDLVGGRIKDQPVVYMDTYDAIERAVESFKESGFTKIAYLGYSSREKASSERAAFIYDKCMESLGFDYRACSFSEHLSQESSMNAVLKLLDSDDRPEAVYVSDDFLMPGVVQALKAMHVVPGKDITIITLSNRKLQLPNTYNWSVMEFDHELLGRTAVDMLIRMLTGSGLGPCNLALKATWIPGQTHLIKR